MLNFKVLNGPGPCFNKILHNNLSILLDFECYVQNLDIKKIISWTLVFKISTLSESKTKERKIPP